MNILIDGQTLQSPEVNRGIGVYLKNVLNNMVKQSYVHTWYIAVADRGCLKALDPWVAERLIPVENEYYAPSTDYSRTRKYTQALERIVEEKNIDVFWDPNPMMVNVLFIEKSLNCRMFATMYDLIPEIMPVKEWSDTVRNEYKRRLAYLEKPDMTLLCISEATKRDFEERVVQRENLYVTMLAADSRRFYCKRKKNVSTPKIVFTGGFDYRKNIDGAIKAFARMHKKYKGEALVEQATLTIVCNVQENQRGAFYEKLKKLGIEDCVQLPGFIPDEQLAHLYSTCDVFFFPSLYEGFGLPIVEAMLAGAYVVSADNSSLPEVCDGHGLLCDAESIEDMADRLREGILNARRESLEDKEARQKYALGFSWEKTAQETLDILCDDCMAYPKRRIAIVTPWPKQKTGIANFEYRLVPYLSEYFDIDVYVDNTVVSDEEFLPNEYGKLYMIDELDRHSGEYEKIIYQIGNSSDFHVTIYKKLLKFGGIAEIHDFIIHPFFYHAFFLKKDFATYKKALLNGYGKDGLEHYQNVRDKVTCPDNETYPMAHSIAAISEATIFHNHWSAKQIDRGNAFVVPHACFDRDPIDESTMRQNVEGLKKRFSIEKEYVIGCFGFVNQNRRPDVVIDAIEKLSCEGYSVRLFFWGKCNYDRLEEVIQAKNLSNQVHIFGYMDKTDYEAALELTDIVVNLRYPSMGESSGTLCEAMKAGKPIIVSDLNQYQEYPDEVCWKLPVGQNESEILKEMIKCMIDKPEVRRALGENAKHYAERVLSPGRIAEMYANVINRVIDENSQRV